MSRSIVRPHDSEAGFALMLVLAMAATVAIMLYIALPRIAFEAQRDKEQLLIDRGEQYSRAIQLYVRKFNRYPADFAALENTQNIRFLRRRYTDPMNNKKADSDQEMWRIVHVGAGGVFTDSLVYNKKQDGTTDPASEKQNFITEMQQTGGNPVDPNQQQVNLADRRRQSDLPGVPVDPNNPLAPPVPGSDPAQNNPILNNAGQNNPDPANPGQNNLPPGFQFPPGGVGTQPMFGGPLPGSQMPPGVQLPPGVQIPGVNTPPGQANGGPPTAAVNMINNLLTTPRPGGLAGLTGPTVDQFGNPLPGAAPNAQAGGGAGAQTPASGTVTSPSGQAAGQTIGGGIAGVASRITQDGIKIYADQKTYNKWEFVYDVSKDKSRGGGQAIPQPAANGASPATPGTTLGTTPATTPGINTGTSASATAAPVAAPTTP